MSCKKCNLELLLDDVIKCVQCFDKLHYACVGLSEGEFKKILPMNIKKWKCPKCRQPKGKPTASSSNSPKTQPILVINDHSGDNSGNPPSIVSIDTEALLRNMDSKFLQISRDMAELKNSFNARLDALSNSIQTWAGKFREIEEAVNSMHAEVCAVKEVNRSLQAESAAVKEDNVFLRTQLELVHKTIDDQEQRSRQCNIEIQNVPQRSSENLVHLVTAMGSVINVPIAAESIRAVHRVAQNVQSERPKNIVVELCSRRLRDDVIAAVRARRGLAAGQLLAAAGGGGGGARLDERALAQPIFINEHLTLKNKILYAKARKEAKEKHYKWVWVKNAAILARKDDNSKVIRIQRDADLAKL